MNYLRIGLVVFSSMLLTKLTPVSAANSQVLVCSTITIGGQLVNSTKVGNYNTAFGWGNHAGLYALLSGSYNDPSWITAIGYTKITGLSTVGHTGAYTDLTGKPTLFSGAYIDLIGKPSLATVATTGVYSDLISKPSLFDGAYSSLSGKPTLFDGVYSSLTGKPTLFDGAYSSLTGSPIDLSSFTNGPGYITSSYTPTINAVSRTINSSTYTPSSTKQAMLLYNISISCTATIGGASSGQVLLQYSTNSGSSWIDAGILKNSNTITLAIALNSVTIQTASITAMIPVNALCRLVPTTSGTTTITYVSGQEVY